jgi:hypothetical protein
VEVQAVQRSFRRIKIIIMKTAAAAAAAAAGGGGGGGGVSVGAGG